MVTIGDGECFVWRLKQLVILHIKLCVIVVFISRIFTKICRTNQWVMHLLCKGMQTPRISENRQNSIEIENDPALQLDLHRQELITEWNHVDNMVSSIRQRLVMNGRLRMGLQRNEIVQSTRRID